MKAQVAAVVQARHQAVVGRALYHAHLAVHLVAQVILNIFY